MGEDGRTHYAMPTFLPQTGQGLLVFEELNRCPRYMATPCLQLLTARQLNDYGLPRGWLPCAAINDAEEGYGVEELDAALLSRFLRVKVVPEVTAWVQWARASQHVHETIVAFVEQSSRFLKPVLIGDTIAPELEVSELVPKTDTGLLKITTRVKNQRGEIVLEGMHAYLIKKRPRT